MPNPLDGKDYYYPSVYTNNGVVYHPLHKHIYDYYMTNLFARMSNDRYSYIPFGRIWINNNCTHIYVTTGSTSTSNNGPSKNKQPYFTNSVRSGGYFVSTARVADYYLDYTIGGPISTNGDQITSASGLNNAVGNQDGFLNCSTNMTNWRYNFTTNKQLAFSTSTSNNRTNSTNQGFTNNNYSGANTSELDFHSTHHAKPQHFWSFRQSQWVSINNNNVLDESYWLNRTQAYLVREQQGATVYTIMYGTPSASQRKQMMLVANDPSALSTESLSAIASQPYGKYYQTTTDPEELRAVFREIGLRISTILTR
jgi:hypothetical protein